MRVKCESPVMNAACNHRANDGYCSVGELCSCVYAVIVATLSETPLAKNESAWASAELAGIKEKYNELIMAVATKRPGHTRHDMALGYIKRAEEVASISAAKENT